MVIADDFYRRTRYVIAASALGILACTVLRIARVILLLFFAAVLLSILLCALVEWVMQHTRLLRLWAMTIVCGTGLLVLGLSFWLRGPALVEQFGELAAQLPSSSMQVWTTLSTKSWAQWLTARIGASAQISSYVAFLLGKMGNAITGTASFALGALVVFFSTLYLSSEPAAYLDILFRFIPAEYRVQSQAALDAAAKTLRSWLIAKVISMAAIGAMISLGLWLLKISLAGTLGTIAALMTFVPNLGAIVSVVPAGLLAFAISPQKGWLTLALFALAHFLEGNVVTPRAEREFVKMLPALTLAV